MYIRRYGSTTINVTITHIALIRYLGPSRLSNENHLTNPHYLSCSQLYPSNLSHSLLLQAPQVSLSVIRNVVCNV